MIIWVNYEKNQKRGSDAASRQMRHPESAVQMSFAQVHTPRPQPASGRAPPAASARYRRSVGGCLHHPAIFQQTSSKRPTLARVFWIHLLKVCRTFAGLCKHPITLHGSKKTGEMSHNSCLVLSSSGKQYTSGKNKTSRSSETRGLSVFKIFLDVLFVFADITGWEKAWLDVHRVDFRTFSIALQLSRCPTNPFAFTTVSPRLSRETWFAGRCLKFRQNSVSLVIMWFIALILSIKS